MTDETLRQLEREWKETNSDIDEAAYLQERVRAGDLDAQALELAAQLGHSAATIAQGERTWLRDLATFPRTAQLRVFLAAIRACRAGIAQGARNEFDHLIQIEDYREDLVEPGETDDAARERSVLEQLGLLDLGVQRYEAWCLAPQADETYDEISTFLEGIGEGDLVTGLLRTTLWDVVQGVEDEERRESFNELAAFCDDEAAFRNLIRDEVVPWLLG